MDIQDTWIRGLMSRSDGFLSDVSFKDVQELDTCVVQGRFDLNRFDCGLFKSLNVARPEKLAPAIEKRQAEFLAGRAMAASALAGLNVHDCDIPIGEDRAPIWPQGIVGSISHARGHCVALVSRDPQLAVGIDIELPAKGSALKSIQSVTMTETERDLIHSQTALESNIFATLAFSAKETLYKALFPTVQSYFGFECAEVIAPPSEQAISLRLTKTLHPALQQGAVFSVCYERGADYVLTWLIRRVPAA